LPDTLTLTSSLVASSSPNVSTDSGKKFKLDISY
jgi:hypothetical protein